jgi:ABC-type multidrug transport system fused ATPase/permease subunit
VTISTRFSSSHLIGSIKVLPASDRRRVMVVVIVQILMGFFDLLGVALVGVIGSLSVSGIQSKGPGDSVKQVLDLIGASNISFQQQIAVLGILAGAVLVSRTVFSFLIMRRTIYFLSRRSSFLSSMLIRKILTQDILFIRRRSSQETLFAVTTGATSITTGVIGSLVSLVADLSMILVLGIGLLFIDVTIALSSFTLFGIVGLFLYFYLQKRAAELGRESTVLAIESNERILQVLNSYREMMVRNRRFYFADEISKTRLKAADVSAELAFMPNISKYAIEAAMIIGLLLVSASQFLFLEATQAIATLSIFLVASARIAPAILRMQQGAIQIKNSLAVAGPTLDFITELSTLNEVEYAENVIDFNHAGFSPSIKIGRLDFTYPNSSTPAIKCLDLLVDPGQQIALVGSSGAGKSTLVDLLLGVITPTNGKVEISGVCPRKAITNWPGAISYVPQDIYLVSGSILENIVLGYPLDEVDMSQVIRAIKLSSLDGYIENLPDGINHQVGENGDKLSGGQRQRLALARALYSNPKILILDEATSSLDGETEAEIAESIKGMKGEITVVMIAHRLSTVRSADVVIYMNDGAIVSTGTFEKVRHEVKEFDIQAQLMGL